MSHSENKFMSLTDASIDSLMHKLTGGQLSVYVTVKESVYVSKVNLCLTQGVSFCIS